MDIIRTHSADRRRGLIRVDVCWCGSTGHPMSGKCRCSLAALVWPPSVLEQGLAFSGVMITTQTPGRSMSKELESLYVALSVTFSHHETWTLAMWNRAISRLGNEAWLEWWPQRPMMPFTVFSRYIPQTASLFIFTSFLAFDRNFCGSVKQLRRRVLKQRQQRPQPGSRCFRQRPECNAWLFPPVTDGYRWLY